MFDDGILEIYEKQPAQSVGGKPTSVLTLYKTAYFGEMSFSAKEYYTARQANTKVEKKVRIHQDKSICNKHVVVVGGVQYDVGRTYNSITKGILVTELSLERVTAQYVIG